MKLKRLEMEGFKSFCDRTVLDFHEGITAIVGPNGTGKSNILDSIRWVLGEQSAKALRGQEMADCIFHGAAGRKASGMAEVTLTFSDCETVLGTDYHEVQITRRVFRDGVGEYALNGVDCRLKDIQRLFLDTGIGRAAYSIMEQGKIDQILSSKPEDRRAIFEEAAGVMRFKVQKREAERKLEGTEANLLRLADILREVRRQIGSLQRQAGKARRHREIFDKLKRFDLALSARQRDQLLLKIDELSSAQAKTKADLERAQLAEASCEQAVRGQRTRLEEADRAWRDAEREVVAAQAEEVRCGERASMQAQRAEELGAAIERARGEIALAERQNSAQEDLIRSLTAEMEKVRSDFQQAEQVCHEAQGRVSVARRQREDAVAEMELIRAKREAAQRGGEGARARAHAEELTTRQRSETLDKIRIEISAKENEGQSERVGLEELFRRLGEAEALFPEARDRLKNAEEELRRAESDLVHAEKKLSEAESERTLARSREEAVRERSTGEAELCLKVGLEKGQEGAEALWPALRIRPGYEVAISLALGPVLDGVLVHDIEAMARAMEEDGGVASGILLSKSVSPKENKDWAEGAWNFVEGAPEWQSLLSRLLADICIVGTWEEAKALHANRPEATVICRDGRMISAKGWQRRGKARNSRPGRTECEAAKELELRLDRVAAEATTLVGMIRDRIQKGREDLEASRNHERQIRQSLDEIRREYDRKEAQVRGLVSETARRKDETNRIEQEILIHQKIAQEKNEEAARYRAEEQALDHEIQGSEKRKQEAESEEVRLNDALTDRRVERSAQQQRRDSCAAQLHPAEARRKELADLVLKRREEISADTGRMESARSESTSSTEAQQVASLRAKEIEASTSGLKQARENEVALLTEKEAEVVRWRLRREKASMKSKNWPRNM